MTDRLLQIGDGDCRLSCVLDGQNLRVDQIWGPDRSWLHSAHSSGLFGVQVNGSYRTCQQLKFTGLQENHAREGVVEYRLRFESQGWAVEQVFRFFQGQSVIEFQPVIHNTGREEIDLQRVDSIDLTLSAHGVSISGYSGNWGSEFEPVRYKPYQHFVLESRSGRSSKGHHPWAAILSDEGEALTLAVAWSGNWVLRFEPQQEGGFHLSGGLHDWGFEKRLKPGDTFEGVPLVLAVGADLNEVCRHLARVGQRFWYPANELSRRLPVEWNHWWPYEDVEINEGVFLANAEKAAELGFEVCTLDAGWFGPPDADTFWYDYRGDWHLVNQRRFPHGIRFLADRVHELGMKFGIWCEIEALGEKARLTIEHPELPAQRDGRLLGYVCMGNPAAQEWAYQTLARLVHEYGADWIKVDFNLDPGAGCNRSDHGHQQGDGLYEHYRGYYNLLARIRQDFPEVVLENCSSGGLRIDLGMLRHTHATYLSDPDWPVHDLQIFWGASTMLPASRLLHWTYSHWRNNDPPPYQRFDPFDPALTPQKWDYYTRISMLGWYGISQKLIDIPAWLAERIAQHNRIYKDTVRRFIRDAELFRLTPQPLRSGIGERWAAFQYSLPDGREHLLFIFRLPGGESSRRIRLQQLDPQRLYTVRSLEGEVEWVRNGASLMQDGLEVGFLQEEESLLLKVV